MSILLVAIILSLGGAGWFYNKQQSHSGYNTKQSLTAAAIVAVALFIVIELVLGLVV